MLQKTRGIVLHYTRYSESSIIAHVYTEIFGRKTFICSGIKSKKTNNKLVFFQPLSLIEIECYYKPADEINRIKEVKTLVPLFHITNDVTKSSIALFIAEVLYRTLQEEEPNSGLFTFLQNSIQFLENIDKGVSNFHLSFLIHYTRYLGIFPQSDFDDFLSGNEWIQRLFDIRSEERYFSEYTNKIKNDLSRLHNSFNSKLDSINLNHNERIVILKILISYLKLHYTSIDKIKSLNILKEIFEDE